MATAIHAKTYSGDEYLWCICDDLNEELVHEFMKEKLGDEYEYLDDWDWTYDKFQTTES
jgi:hypothetical protein